jgi:hypothetical protein
VAEIPIQPKRGGSKLPWIIGAIAVLLLLWLLLGRRGGDDARPAGADTTKTSSIMATGNFAAASFVTMNSRRT